MSQNLFNHPIIAAVREIEHLSYALHSSVDTVFMMCGELSNITDIVEDIHRYKKNVFLHVDLIKGLANDKESISFLANKVNPDGIISTKNHIIKAAKQSGLLTIQHVFMLDTQALSVGIRNSLANQPDAVEMMPGLMPKVISQFKKEVALPLVVGGLLQEKQEIFVALNAGADAVVSGAPALWNLDLNEK
ncbi:glycerol-3-phosphate responsive antiterminator [Cohnella sp.]|uniref:glycerol-3-phosphate responsive antiterminator n=1 Tax=Cohnella sp. TaxID=1883426 RepID=UPI0035656753